MKTARRFAPRAAVLALIIIQIIFVATYVSHERTIYFWDHAMYFSMAQNLFEVAGDGSGNFWVLFKNSLSENYNLVFTLPSLVSFYLFGVSRLVFILTNLCVYFLSYECAVAFFLRRALRIDWATALLLSFGAAIATPPLWLPLLEGYPDNGAGACLAVAAALLIGGTVDAKLIRRGLTAGALLGCAVLLRRHFAYPAMALLVTSGLLSLWGIYRATARQKKFLNAVLYYSAAAASMAGLLFLVAPGFVQNALTIDYNALYQSYQRPVDVFLHFTLGAFGYGIILITLCGLYLLTRLGSHERRLAVFSTLFTLLWLVVWCLGPDQMGHHYMLHALPLVIATGIAGCFVCLKKQNTKQARLITYAGGLALLSNALWALWLSPNGVWPNDNGTPGLLSAPRPPVVRPDYDELHHLADYLAATTKHGDRIMVVGSSFILNQDIFNKIYLEKSDGVVMAIRFPKAPEIDHEEPGPFDAFAASNIYLVPTPAQYHLDPAGQRVVTAAANQFPPPPARKDMFHADDGEFQLADGVTLKVWRRTEWKPGLLFDALADIRRDGPQDLQFDQQWATVTLPLRAQIRSHPDGTSLAAGLFNPDYAHMRLFFDHPLIAGSNRIGMVVAGNCSNPRFELRVVDAKGQVASSQNFSPAAVPSQLYQSFTVPDKIGESYFLELDLAVTAAPLCQAELQALRVEKN